MTQDKHTALPWKIRKSPHSDLDFFIQGPKNKKSDPYDIEIMGEDTHPDLYSDGQKMADGRLIVRAVNNHYQLIEALEEAMWMIENYEGTSDENDVTVDKARQALSNAKGGDDE